MDREEDTSVNLTGLPEASQMSSSADESRSIAGGLLVDSFALAQVDQQQGSRSPDVLGEHELNELDTPSLLREALSIAKISKAAFARQAQLNPSDLQRYLDGQHSMSLTRMQKVLESHGLSVRIQLSRG